jgi:hypothetical protein
MLLGFYAGKMRQDVFDMLALFRRTASTSRKAFWLFKSFNHITSSIHLVQKIMLGDFSSLILADLLEQILLACYFLCENIVFFIRVKALPWNENEVEPWTSLYWFLSDFAGLIAALIRFYNSWYSCYFNGLSLSLDCKQQLLEYRRMYFDFSTLIISTLEVMVSSDFAQIHQRLLDLPSFGDGFLGLFGMLSSLMILGDGAAKMWIELSEREK